MKDFKIQKKKVEDLIPAPYNPRKISERAKAGLSFSIERFGYVEPIIWNERTGHVIGGHQRLTILKEKGIEEIDVVVVNFDDDYEKGLNLTLNNQEIQGKFNDFAQDLVDSIAGEMPEDFEGLLLNDLQSDLEKMFKENYTDNREDDEMKCPCCNFVWQMDDRDIVDVRDLED